jgi:hypothetical protein
MPAVSVVRSLEFLVLHGQLASKLIMMRRPGVCMLLSTRSTSLTLELNPDTTYHQRYCQWMLLQWQQVATAVHVKQPEPEGSDLPTQSDGRLAP